ncbi:MAG: sucrase ferredoxin [Gaiellaceae bacterium]
MTSARCADLSEAAREPISATATNALNWLLVEVRGTWPRDVSDLGGFEPELRTAITNWLEQTPSSRLLFIRRPGSTAEHRTAFVVHASDHEPLVRRLELTDADGFDPARDGDQVSSPLVLVCGHGTRDACCALRGSAVFGALREIVPPDALWLSSHQGGHRFAANVLVLPAGIQLGRITPADARDLVSDALQGRIALEHYRGRVAYTPREQAAETAIREARGLLRATDLTLVGDRGTQVTFRDVDGHELVAVPHDVAGPAVPASCGAEPEPQRHWLAEIHENP